MKVCPCCGQLVRDPGRPKRICAVCGHPIKRYHKWLFGPDGRPVHRNCEHPEAPGEVKDPPAAKQAVLEVKK